MPLYNSEVGSVFVSNLLRVNTRYFRQESCTSVRRLTFGGVAFNVTSSRAKAVDAEQRRGDEGRQTSQQKEEVASHRLVNYSADQRPNTVSWRVFNKFYAHISIEQRLVATCSRGTDRRAGFTLCDYTRRRWRLWYQWIEALDMSRL